MFYCPTVKYFWQELENFLDVIMKVKIKFTCTKVISNKVENSYMHIVSLIVLMAKQHIYYCKCSGKRIKFNKFIGKVEKLCEIELYNAKYNGMYKKLRKWIPNMPECKKYCQ